MFAFEKQAEAEVNSHKLGNFQIQGKNYNDISFNLNRFKLILSIF